MSLLDRIRRWLNPPPRPRPCFRCDHPADREWTVGGVVYGFCWLHASDMRLLIRLSPPEPEPDPRRRCR